MILPFGTVDSSFLGTGLYFSMSGWRKISGLYFRVKYYLQCDRKEFDRVIKSIPSYIILIIKNALPQVAYQPHLHFLMINKKQYGVFSLTYTLSNFMRTQPIVPLINLL